MNNVTVRFFTILHCLHAPCCQTHGQCLTGWKTPHLGHSLRKQGETYTKTDPVMSSAMFLNCFYS